jgi:SAM-dependent methyltransferase
VSQSGLYEVWCLDPDRGEQAMEENHHRFWEKVLDLVVEPDLSTAAVLDFGCNQGGFLRFLHARKPFARGLGVDLARHSVEVANQRKGGLPVTYLATPTLEPYGGQFDLAFSTAVVYLLPGLPDHARQMRHALKPQGVYYATYSDYGGNPSLSRLRETIDRSAAVPMRLHTLDAIGEAFHREGFAVSLRRIPPTGFIPLAFPDPFFDRVADRLQYEYSEAYMFRFVAPGAALDTAS